MRGGFDDFTFGDFVIGRVFNFLGSFGGLTTGDERGRLFGRLLIGDRYGGFFAGRAVVNLDPVLVKPEFDFFVTVLVFGGHFKDVDFDFATTVEIIDDGVGDLGDHAAADVTFDAVFIFVHEEEGVGLVEVFVETLVDLGEALTVIVVTRGEPTAEGKTWGGLGLVDGVWLGGDGAGPVDNFVAAAFEVATPVEGAFVEFGAAGDD